MGQVKFTVNGLDYAAFPPFGPDHSLSRLFSSKEGGSTFPVFDPSRMDRVSGSAFMDRAALSSAIASLNPHLPAPPEEACYIVAGQQPGLLTGPMYTFLKAVTAISLAREMSEKHGKSVLPLFWVASEDHDVLEVNRVTVEGARFVHPFDGELRRGAVPQVGEIDISPARAPLLDFLRQNLRETEFTPDLLDWVASMDFSDYGSAFSSLMEKLFAPWALRLVNPLALRPLTAPVLARLVAQWPQVRHAFEGGAAPMRGLGFEPPLSGPGVFEIVEGNRKALEFQDRSVRMEKGECSFEEAAERILARPSDFSSGAGLRPILQDGVLPVAAFLGGPSELLYLWQIQPVYEVAGVTPSPLWPRMSATFVKEGTLKTAEKAGLDRDRLFQALDDRDEERPPAGHDSAPAGHDSASTGHDSARASHDPASAGHDPALAGVEEAARTFLDQVEQASPAGKEKWLEKSKRTLRTQVEKMVRRLKDDREAALGQGRARLRKIAEALLPQGKPQERAANPFQFINLYGPDFIEQAVVKLNPLKPEHQVVLVKTVKQEEESQEDGS